jgi:hypothetical protein
MVDPQYGVLSTVKGYIPLYKMNPSDRWLKLMRHGFPDYQPSVSMAIVEAKRFVDIELNGDIRAACPTPTNALSEDQRRFYEKRAGQQAVFGRVFSGTHGTMTAPKRMKKPTLVMDRGGRVLRKIGAME